MESEKQDQLLTVSLSAEEKHILKTLAREQGRTLSGMVRWLLREAARSSNAPLVDEESTYAHAAR
jgi:hypothetical protein